MSIKFGSTLLLSLLSFSSFLFVTALRGKDSSALILGVLGIFGLLYSTHAFGHLVAGWLLDVEYNTPLLEDLSRFFPP